VSRYWTREALAWIVVHPAAWLRLTAKKSLLLSNAEEVTDTEDQGTYAEFSRLLAGLSRWFHFGVLLPMAAAGAWLARRRDVRILYLLALTLALSTVAFFVVARYRLPLVPLLVLFAAAGAGEVVAAVRSRQWTRLAVAACVAAIAAGIANWPIITPGSQRAPTHYNLGLARAARGDIDGAGRYFAEAVQLDPNLGVAWGNLGVVYGLKGNLADAERCFREALARDPDLADTHANLASLLEADGRRDDAIAHYREAVRLRPWGAGLQTKLGLALLGGGRVAEAIPVLDAAISADSTDRVAHFALGAALADQGQREPALVHLRRARALAEESHDDSLLHAVDERTAILLGSARGG
jgi:tetratricopeptide (TPR) repeat protein